MDHNNATALYFLLIHKLLLQLLLLSAADADGSAHMLTLAPVADDVDSYTVGWFIELAAFALLRHLSADCLLVTPIVARWLDAAAISVDLV